MKAERFTDRRAAGVALAQRLTHYKGRDDVLVLGLPRGGVPVAHEVARALEAPLDVLVVRKLGVPGQPEVAMGAIASGGAPVLNEDFVDRLNIPPSAIEAVTREERAELERRERAYRGARKAPEVGGRVVIVVDDGLATGATMKAAVQALREQRPARIVVAVPVGAPDTCAELADIADEVACARQPMFFAAVSEWYGDFAQTSDAEVRALLEAGAPAKAPGG